MTHRVYIIWRRFWKSNYSRMNKIATDVRWRHRQSNRWTENDVTVWQFRQETIARLLCAADFLAHFLLSTPVIITARALEKLTPLSAAHHERQTYWYKDRQAKRLTSWLIVIDKLRDWLTDWLADWLADWLGRGEDNIFQIAECFRHFER